MSHNHDRGDLVVMDGHLECGDGTVPVPDGAYGQVVTSDDGLVTVDFGGLGLRIDLPAEVVMPA